MGSGGLKSRARCAGFSVTEIGNRKERLRVREAGASAAGRGQRPYASFPDRQPKRNPVPPNREAIKKQESGSEAKPDSGQAASNRYPVTPAPAGRNPKLRCRNMKQAV